jgi:hypothetical protein
VNAPDPWENWVNWIACHPRTALYVIAVTTLNLILNVVELVMS